MDKSAKLGLWDRIRAKRERGEAPAKPGDKDFPDSKMWKKLTNKPKKQAAASPARQRASRINKSLRKWNCKCSNVREFGEKLAADCPNGNCAPGTPPQPPQPPQPPKQYSDVAFSPEYARESFKQHKIPFSPNASDQMLYKRFTHMGAIKPGAKPNAFQEMVGQRYGGLPPAPPQPDVKTYQPYPPLDPKRGVPQTVKTNAAREFAEKLAAWLSRQG